MAGGAQNAAVSAGRHIAARPRIGLLDGAGGKDALLLDEDGADTVAALVVRPHPRGDVVDAIDDVLRSVVADHALRPLGGVAADRHGRVDEKIEPVDRLLDPRAPLGPDRAVVFAARQDALHRVGRARQARPRHRGGQMHRLVREEIGAAPLRRDIAGASGGASGDGGVGAPVGRQPLRVTRGRQDPVEVDLGLGGDQVAGPVVADLQPIDLLEAARAVGEKSLPRLCFGGAGERAFLLPGGAVRLPRHVGQRIDPVLGAQDDLIDRLVARAAPLRAHLPVAAEPAVRRPIELGGVGFERVRAELLDIDRDRRREALRAQCVEPRRRAVGVR